MSGPRAHEGWRPEITDGETLAEVIEEAFDYRGDVTIATRDGARQVGYLFNRRRDVPAPFVQILPASGGDPQTITYGEIQSIAFTGRDTAAGNSYSARGPARRTSRKPLAAITTVSGTMSSRPKARTA